MHERTPLRIEDLDHLHDAAVLTLTWRSAGGGPRDVILAVAVPPDAGRPFADYRGKSIAVVFADAVVVRFAGHGAVSGPELFNSAGPGLLPDAGADRDRLRAAGLYAGDVTVSIAFHSGSELSVACGRIELAAW